jgi:hypothetical protein
VCFINVLPTAEGFNKQKALEAFKKFLSGFKNQERRHHQNNSFDNH